MSKRYGVPADEFDAKWVVYSNTLIEHFGGEPVAQETEVEDKVELDNLEATGAEKDDSETLGKRDPDAREDMDLEDPDKKLKVQEASE